MSRTRARGRSTHPSLGGAPDPGAAGKEIVRKTRNRPQHWNPADTLDGLPEDRFVPCPRDPIENHPCQRHFRVQGLQPQDQGGSRPGRLRHVDAQKNRGLQELRQLRAGITPFRIHPVIETSVSFDEGHVGAEGCIQE